MCLWWKCVQLDMPNEAVDLWPGSGMHTRKFPGYSFVVNLSTCSFVFHLRYAPVESTARRQGRVESPAGEWLVPPADLMDGSILVSVKCDHPTAAGMCSKCRWLSASLRSVPEAIRCKRTAPPNANPTLTLIIMCVAVTGTSTPPPANWTCWTVGKSIAGCASSSGTGYGSLCGGCCPFLLCRVSLTNKVCGARRVVIA